MTRLQRHRKRWRFFMLDQATVLLLIIFIVTVGG
jgi:hypothetical protein